MIVIRMTGGLGNQMFQYALFLKLKSQDKIVKLDDRTEYENQVARSVSLWVFGISYETATQEEMIKLTDSSLEPWARIRRKLFGRRSLIYCEQNINFDPEVLTQNNAYFTGYFQSEQYFKDIEPLVRKTFCFTPKIWENLTGELVNKMQNYQKQIDDSCAVSVHIRRGDYLDKRELYGDICTEAYYQKAANLIREKYSEAVFFIFSNDPEWSKLKIEELYGDSKRFVIIEGTSEENGYLDMMLMSHCKHHIIANSSFSWWGAWLSKYEEKMVIAPSKWNNFMEQTDIYAEGMIRVNSDGELV